MKQPKTAREQKVEWSFRILKKHRKHIAVDIAQDVCLGFVMPVERAPTDVCSFSNLANRNFRVIPFVDHYHQDFLDRSSRSVYGSSAAVHSIARRSFLGQLENRKNKRLVLPRMPES